MSGARAAKQLRKAEGGSPSTRRKKKGGSLFHKTRAQELAGLRQKAQKKALAKLHDALTNFPLLEDEELQLPLKGRQRNARAQAQEGDGGTMFMPPAEGTASDETTAEPRQGDSEAAAEDDGSSIPTRPGGKAGDEGEQA